MRVRGGGCLGNSWGGERPTTQTSVPQKSRVRVFCPSPLRGVVAWCGALYLGQWFALDIGLAGPRNSRSLAVPRPRPFFGSAPAPRTSECFAGALPRPGPAGSPHTCAVGGDGFAANTAKGLHGGFAGQGTRGTRAAGRAWARVPKSGHLPTGGGQGWSLYLALEVDAQQPTFLLLLQLLA